MLLRVHGIGVLISGASGSGKSITALELVARGHALVADDAVEIRKSPGARLEATCVPLLRGRLAVRELGVLDLRALYGSRAVRRRQRLDLVIRLTTRRPLNARALLSGRRSTRRILNCPIPVLSLSVNVGHNLATLVEAACLAQRLRQRGYNTVRTFAAQQLKAIKNTS